MKNLIAKLFILALCSSIFANVAMIKPNGAVYTEENGTLTIVETVPAGTLFQKWISDTVIKDLKVNDKIFKDVEFYQVKYQDKDCFVKVSETEIIAAATVLGVITKDATLFKNNRPSSFLNEFISKGTIVTTDFTEVEECQNQKLSFIEISFFDTKSNQKRTSYVQLKKLSIDEDDVKSSKLISE